MTLVRDTSIRNPLLSRENLDRENLNEGIRNRAVVVTGWYQQAVHSNRRRETDGVVDLGSGRVMGSSARPPDGSYDKTRGIVSAATKPQKRNANLMPGQKNMSEAINSRNRAKERKSRR